MNKTSAYPPADPVHEAHENDSLKNCASAAAKTRRPRRILLTCSVVFAILMIGVALTLFWIYGTDTYHENRNSIWWPTAAQNLIPPGATAITLRQDHLDHYATYKISEADLNDFLKKRFANDGNRTPVEFTRIGSKVGPLGWVLTKNTVVYSYSAKNGAMNVYYHDSKTGLTYQDSAYW